MLDASAGSTDQPLQIPCGDTRCTAPAVCVASVDTAICRCPIGYIDLRLDGSDCRDIDECLIPDICDRDGRCTNTPGSYECECAGPVLVALGNRCVCAPGYTRNSSGECLALDGHACAEDGDCLNKHCEGGTCCAVSCERPGACHTSEGAMCEDGSTCSYPALPDGTTCDDALACTVDSTCEAGRCTGGKGLDCDDDNPCTDDSCEEPFGCRNKNHKKSCDDSDPCTLDDACNVGQCGGTAKSCESLDDRCTRGSCDPETGQCMSVPRPDGTACDDASSCSIDDRCTAGSCSGANACGPHASMCAVTQSAPQCGCEAGFVDTGTGRCAPSDDECAAQSSCSPDADCEDPSNAAGDFTCTCKPGFIGDGHACSPQDPCLDNPCGPDRGTCTSDGPGSHNCRCIDGYVEQHGSCVCDMSGTFVVRARLDLSWNEMGGLIEPGSDSVYGYAIERYSYDGEGELQVQYTPCGNGAFDLCGVGVAPTLAAEAYAQFIPTDVWDLPSMPKFNVHVSAPQRLPGTAFVTDTIAVVQGIALADPLGAWPERMQDIAGTPSFDGSAVNGARWLDQDDDAFVGLTSYVVPPGGVPATGSQLMPPRPYGASSAVCPRSGGPHTQYAYWPAPAQGETGSSVPLRIKRFYSATRVVGAYQGTITSCDEVEGEIHGPDGEPLQIEMRVGGCMRASEDGETACPPSAVEFLDSAQPQVAVRASFKLKRWPNDAPVSCAAARSFPFE